MASSWKDGNLWNITGEWHSWGTSLFISKHTRKRWAPVCSPQWSARNSWHRRVRIPFVEGRWCSAVLGERSWSLLERRKWERDRREMDIELEWQTRGCSKKRNIEERTSPSFHWIDISDRTITQKLVTSAMFEWPLSQSRRQTKGIFSESCAVKYHVPISRSPSSGAGQRDCASTGQKELFSVSNDKLTALVKRTGVRSVVDSVILQLHLVCIANQALTEQKGSISGRWAKHI